MRNFHIKSLILGIGIGIVLTSVISMVYSFGTKPVQKISSEEVKKMARQLGMVESSQIIKDIDSVKDNNSKAYKDAKPKSNDDKIQFEIVEGDTSEIVADKLIDLGLIDSRAGFLLKLEEMGLSTRIKPGKYKVKRGISIQTLIDEIT